MQAATVSVPAHPDSSIHHLVCCCEAMRCRSLPNLCISRILRCGRMSDGAASKKESEWSVMASRGPEGRFGEGHVSGTRQVKTAQAKTTSRSRIEEEETGKFSSHKFPGPQVSGHGNQGSARWSLSIGWEA